ncbi:LytR cell envelope-related transcriptional attenuator [Micromonospora pattaloongensis]|uniref:LytR cell envelope-related transcriptional attenuator n=1 Tax=Micromonospora pattaloongensis TaxID=405436 RepID=A0A1H3K6E1_9ACTN|nr:LytR C-terminal domain-containing protein [Micromonospora pattaloongensis]SDY47419.1 LytR cell envelope-related transcriptional attenuator [Micromonospora pattaloongensis]
MSFARVRALVVVGALALFALVFVVVAVVRDTQSGPTAAKSCPDGYALANIRLREPKDVRINVYNATDTPGLATKVGTEFKNRKFQVQKEGNDPQKKGVDGVAVLRYGPQAVGSAHLLRAYFLDQAKVEYDPKRKDDAVDVVIGNAYQQLATTTEVNQSLVELGGKPQLPPQTCAADEQL